MDNKNDLILQLAKMLQDNRSKSSDCEMPCIDDADSRAASRSKSSITKMPCINDTFKPLEDIKKPDITTLRKYLNNRLELANVDTDKAVFFMLIPYSNCQWKVFVADANKKTYDQLDDYFGVIIEKIENKKPVFLKEKFFVSR